MGFPVNPRSGWSGPLRTGIRPFPSVRTFSVHTGSNMRSQVEDTIGLADRVIRVHRMDHLG